MPVKLGSALRPKVVLANVGPMKAIAALLLCLTATTDSFLRVITPRGLQNRRLGSLRQPSRSGESSLLRLRGASSDNEAGENEENEENVEKIELADGSFQGALIKEADQPTFEEFKAMQAAESSSSGGATGRALDYNWRMGLCKHYIAFEGSDTIRRFKFMGDLLAFGMITGQVALIRMSTGDILDRFKHHNCEVTSIDFDGINLVTGAADGKVAYYSLTYGGEGSTEKDTTTDLDALLGAPENAAEDLDPSAATVGDGMSPQNAMGDVKGVYDSFHTRSVTSVKLVRIPGGKKAIEKNYLISTSIDRSLNCMDIDSGEVVYSVELDSAPICMDSFSSLDSGNTYLSVGTIDGKVLVISPKTGKTLISFQADDRVRSIHFTSENVIVTGGNSGAVRRWNLEADEGTSRQSNSVPRKKKKATKKKDTSASAQEGAEAVSPTTTATTAKEDGSQTFKNSGRFIDFYFQSLIEGQDKSEDSSSSSASIGSSASGGAGADKSIGKTSRSPTVEKAASAIRDKVNTLTTAAEQEQEEEEGVVSVSSAQALGSVMNERQRVYVADDQKSPVVSLQADDTKILACYEDGNIKAWDIKSMANLFDLQGRTSLISCCQFDATRLIADGTHHILVTHDFSDSPEAGDSEQNSSFTYDGAADAEGDNTGDDGKPSATS